MNAHLPDLILCIPLLWGAIRGFMRGLIFEIALLAGLALGLFGGFALAGLASDYLSRSFSISGTWLPVLSFTLVFITISFLVILLGKLLTKVVGFTGLGIFNRILGLLFGLTKWVLILSAVLWLIKPLDENFHLIPAEKKENSYLMKPLEAIGKLMVPVMKNELRQEKEKMQE